MPISKRDRLAGALAAGGLFRAIEALPRRPGLLVLNYHRIGSGLGDGFDDGTFSATTEAFREQVRYLRDHFAVLGQEELLEAASSGSAADRPAVVITFDDGYRDNFELAFPILRELGVPAFFFIPTAYIDRPRLPWWDRIAYIVKQTRVERIRLDRPHPFEVDLRQFGRPRAIREILGVYKTAGDFGEQEFFEHMEERAEVAVDPEALGGQLFMTWEQIRQMRAESMVIGAHTHTHRILARLPEDEQHEELSTSRARLEAELAEPITTMAYPVGSRQAFSDQTKSLAREAGYRVAFSYYGGINRPDQTDPLDVRRIPVEMADTLPLFRARALLYNLFGSTF